MMNQWKRRLILLAAGLLLPVWAAGDTAGEVTYACSFSSNSREKEENYMTNLVDGNLGTYFTIKNKNEEPWLEIQSEEPVFGLYIQITDRERTDTYELAAEDETGEWEKIGESR